MDRFAANVGFLFTEEPYLDRFAAARAAGFRAVEFAWPTAPLATVRAAIREAGLDVVLINAPAGDLQAGSRGFANLPTYRGMFRSDLQNALELAESVGCPTINVLAGNRSDAVTAEEQWLCLVENLRWAVSVARAYGIQIVTEILNDADTPSYMITRVAIAELLAADVGEPNFGVQLDTYHVATMEGDVIAAARRLGTRIRHVQFADAPGRHEPGSGSVPFDALLAVLRELEYPGAIGLEYVPTHSTKESVDAVRLRFGMSSGSG